MSQVEPKRVLAIEDDPDTLELICGFLRAEFGNTIEIEECLEGKKGLILATQNKYDLILSDVAMPEINGFDVIRQAVRQEVNQDTPVLVISGYIADYQDQLTAPELVNVHYIQKPVSGPKLTKLVRLSLNL